VVALFCSICLVGLDMHSAFSAVKHLQTHLQIHSRRIPLAPDVDLAAIAARTERFTGKLYQRHDRCTMRVASVATHTALCSWCTGAELAAVCREAAMAALREDVQGGEC